MSGVPCRGNGDGHEHGCSDALSISLPSACRFLPCTAKTTVDRLSCGFEATVSSLVSQMELSLQLIVLQIIIGPATFVATQTVLSRYVSMNDGPRDGFWFWCSAHGPHQRSYALHRTIFREIRLATTEKSVGQSSSLTAGTLHDFRGGDRSQCQRVTLLHFVCF